MEPLKKPYVEIVINGNVKIMKFDYNAVADLEEYYGLGIAEIVSKKRIGFSTVRALYWAGLKWKDKGITIQRAGNYINELVKEGRNFEELMEPVKEALERSGLFKFSKTDAAGEEGGEIEGDSEGESPNGQEA